MQILCFHTVEWNWHSPLAVSPAAFERHCGWLNRHRRCRGLSSALEAIDHNRWRHEDGVLVTFDDGFSGVLNNAAPTLRAYSIPATVFVVGKTVSASQSIDWAPTVPSEARVLTKDEILEWRDLGMTVGSHSFSHADFTTLSENECFEDFLAGREVLEDLLREHVRVLAYPRGKHAPHVRRAASRAGFHHAFSLPDGPEVVGPLAIPRAVIVPGNNNLSLSIKSSPLYQRVRGSFVYPGMQRVARRVGLGLNP